MSKSTVKIDLMRTRETRLVAHCSLREFAVSLKASGYQCSSHPALVLL